MFTKMGACLLIFLLYLHTAFSDPLKSYCCLEHEGLFDEDSFCVNPINNTTTPIHTNCSLVDSLPASAFDFTVDDDGVATLMSENSPQSVFYEGEFCVTNQTINSTERYLVLCQVEQETPIVGDDVLGSFMIVSAIFLMLTAVTYAVLPSIRDLQGKSIICFCVSLSLGLTILAIMKLMEYSDMSLCATRGFLTYFFLTASFFWMNAIALQILFRIKRPSVPDYSWRSFGYYALYAWGCPAFITICMAIVNFYPGSHHKPGIGLNHCWFYDKKQQWYYMYSVMTILIFINIAIFMYVSVYLWKGTFSSTHLKELRYKFTMTLRMFILMGLPWIFEMISTFFKAHIIWSILDIFNLLQGFLIFLVLVVLRKRVLKALYKRGLLDCVSGPVEKYLAVAEDAEDIVQHTIDVPLDDKQMNS